MIVQQIGLHPAHAKVRVFRRQGLRKFRRCTFNQLRFLLKRAIGPPSFRGLINIPFYFRFPEICFVGLGVLPLARPFSRPQKRGSPSTSCCCSASFMIAVPARFKYCSTPSSTSIMFPAIDNSSITTRTRPFGCFSTLMFVSLSRHCFAVIPVSIFRGDLSLGT